MKQFNNHQLIPERMDEPDADRAELDRSLKIIRIFNTKLGGTKTSLHAFEKE